MKFKYGILLSLLFVAACGNSGDKKTPAKTPAEIEETVDSDGDGVIDSLDKCAGDDRKVVTLYADKDGDGLGDISISKQFCPGSDVSGYVKKSFATDTDDTIADVDFDGVLDGLDQCAGDDSLMVTLYADTDDDGLGNPLVAKIFCPSDDKTGYVGNDLDTDDSLTDSDLDGVRNDLDKCPNEDDTNWKIYYQDADEDGFGVEGVSIMACGIGNGNFDGYHEGIKYTANGSSFDTDDTVKDSDQDGIEDSLDECADEHVSQSKIMYEDNDGDGLGDIAKLHYICSDDYTSGSYPSNYVENSNDYNDSFSGLDIAYLIDRSGSLTGYDHPDANNSDSLSKGEHNYGEIKAFVEDSVEHIFSLEPSLNLTLSVLAPRNHVSQFDNPFYTTAELTGARSKAEIFNTFDVYTDTGSPAVLENFSSSEYVGGYSLHQNMIEYALNAFDEHSTSDSRRRMIVLIMDGPTCASSQFGGCPQSLCSYRDSMVSRDIEVKIFVPSDVDQSYFSCLVNNTSTDIVTFDSFDKLKLDLIGSSWFRAAQ